MAAENQRSKIKDQRCCCVSFYAMELRKDPITRSWVITSEGSPSAASTLTDEGADAPCRFCPASARETQTVGREPGLDGAPWSARAMVHPAPIYRIEGDPQRTGIGLYD